MKILTIETVIGKMHKETIYDCSYIFNVLNGYGILKETEDTDFYVLKFLASRIAKSICVTYKLDDLDNVNVFIIMKTNDIVEGVVTEAVRWNELLEANDEINYAIHEAYMEHDFDLPMSEKALKSLVTDILLKACTNVMRYIEG